MFGRRRRVAPVVPPAPELSDERIFELLHEKIAELVGRNGQWTLVPRSTDDTDVIFHGLKAHHIAASLTNILRTGKAVLRGETPPPPMAEAVPSAEPTALSWTPGPISVWAEPTRSEPTRGEPVQAQHSEAPPAALPAPGREARKSRVGA